MSEIVAETKFLIGRRPMMSYFPRALATIALWKSAPMKTYTNCGNADIRERLTHDIASFRDITCNYDWCLIDVAETKIIELASQLHCV